jgi:hemerythrin-like domain-containing protein
MNGQHRDTMSQPIRNSSLKAAPLATFEQPFEMLTACHERVDRMLQLLARLREHVAKNGADADARKAAQDVMRYFDQAAPQHHEDEELHVFPPLVAQGDPQAMALVNRLRQDHRQMEAHWSQAREVLAAIAAGELDALSPDQEAVLDVFAGMYAGHIEAEEQLAYPAAEKLLDSRAITAMGEEMMKRRGVK